MKNKTFITVPLAMATDPDLPSSAKAVYLILKSFQKGRQKVILSHQEIIERSHLSHLTVSQALKSLEQFNWISIERNSGSANTYTFTSPDF